MVSNEAKRESGTIKCYYPLKGYGFIQRQRGKDVFFFRTDAASETILYDGVAVDFILRTEAKGPRAFDIVRIG